MNTSSGKTIPPVFRQEAQFLSSMLQKWFILASSNVCHLRTHDVGMTKESTFGCPTNAARSDIGFHSTSFNIRLKIKSIYQHQARLLFLQLRPFGRKFCKNSGKIMFLCCYVLDSSQNLEACFK